MYRGMAAQLTLTSDDGDDDTFYVKDAKATQGECTTEGNVLTPEPNMEGVWRYKINTFEGIDTLQWDQLYNFVKGEAKVSD